MRPRQGFRHLSSPRSADDDDDDDDVASSHLLAELQAAERADRSPPVGTQVIAPDVGESRYTDTYEDQPSNGSNPHSSEAGNGQPRIQSSGLEDDEPPQSIMYEDAGNQEDKDPESSSTPQPFPGSMIRSQNQLDHGAAATEQRGRRPDFATSASASTLRTDSASPPPDLLESGSSDPDDASRHQSASDYRRDTFPSATAKSHPPRPNAEASSSARPGVPSQPLKPSLRAPSSSRSDRGGDRDRDRDLSAAEKGKSRTKFSSFGGSSHNLPSGQRKHVSSQRDMINGDSLSDTSSSDSPGDVFADPSASPGSVPSRPRSRTSSRRSGRSKRSDPWKGLDEKQRALWSWVNVVDLDGYLQEVYEYYTGKGFYCIVLRRMYNLLTSAFVIVFSTFLMSCIDFSKFPKDGHGELKDVVVDRCISRWSVPHIILTWVFIAFFGWKLVGFVLSIPKLLDIKRFYEHLLDVPEADIQTISWPEIVRRIGNIRNQNPTTSLRKPGDSSDAALEIDVSAPKLDAHDVANRIMRQENYLIALFNKDLLDLRVRLPLPHFIVPFVPKPYLLADATGKSPRQYLSFGANNLTKALEWNLRYCLLGYLFDHRGLVRKEFVRGRKRRDSVERLQRRFIFIGIINAIFAPFIVLYLIMYSFFRYFEEYHKNPSSIGSRQYTPYGRWKFREFNELPHLFERRLDQSYPAAKRYIDQFPKEINALTMRFIAFIAGAFAAVLLLITVIDPVFLHFEITPNRTVLFYLGVFTSILAVARGMVPQDNTVFEPEVLLKEVVSYTHYMPGDWEGKLHSRRVHSAFGQIFEMKITVFVQELLSVVLTPFVLWFSLPPCADNIIDFFREFTVHVEGVGYVCSFAVFDFKRHGNVKFGAPVDTHPSEKMMSKEGKMEKSFLHFTATHPEWQPSDPSASIFLSKMTDQPVLRSPQLRKGRLSHQHGPSNELPESDYLRDRSQVYERALQRSIMMRSSTKPLPTRNSSNRPFRRGPRERLESMKEQAEVNEAGWDTAEVVPGAGNGSDESDGVIHGRKGSLKDNGMIGLIQHVMK